MGVPARIIEVVQELIQAVPQLRYFGPAEEDQQIAHGLPIATTLHVPNDGSWAVLRGQW